LANTENLTCLARVSRSYGVLLQVHRYGDIARPLIALLKRDAFRWSPKADVAFQCLKQALMIASALQLPDFNKQFMIECDASGSGFGAVMHQGDCPIAFFSRPVATHHAKLPAYEQELIGLVKAVRHWRPYVWGRFFIIRTNHFSLSLFWINGSQQYPNKLG
jgi:hypothetical protein